MALSLLRALYFNVCFSLNSLLVAFPASDTCSSTDSEIHSTPNMLHGPVIRDLDHSILNLSKVQIAAIDDCHGLSQILTFGVAFCILSFTFSAHLDLFHKKISYLLLLSHSCADISGSNFGEVPFKSVIDCILVLFWSCFHGHLRSFCNK